MESLPDQNPDITRPYTIHLDYFATGSGMTEKIVVVMAASEGAARQRFFETFYPGDSLAAQYFSRGLVITPRIDRELLGRFLAARFLDALERRLRYNATLSLAWAFNMG